jgi:hypothetical protein
MNEAIFGMMIPIIAIVMGISAGIVGIVSRHRQLLQRVDLRHKERLAAMEKGLELPPEVADVDVRRPRYLLRGLVWSLAGAGAFFALRAVAGSDESMLACVPIAIGLAYLIFYALQGRHEQAATPGNGQGGATR